MARLNDLSHGRLDAPRLDPREIVIREGFNYRDTNTEASLKHIAWLKESIRERGVEEPIRVEYKGGTVFVVNGECRVKALRQLWDEGVEVYVPAIVAKGDEAEILAKSMIANGALPPTPLEFGQAASRLLAYGWSPEKVAEYTPPHIRGSKAKAVQYVKDAVELHEAPLGVKKQVKGRRRRGGDYPGLGAPRYPKEPPPCRAGNRLCSLSGESEGPEGRQEAKVARKGR